MLDVITSKYLMPRSIRCPNCNFRHYPVRSETKQYREYGEITILCSCGCRYDVINKGHTSIIRREA